MRKYVPIPITAIIDERLSDAELRLLSKLILKYGTESAKSGTVKLQFTDSDIGRLGMRKSTFYRLLSGLLKCEYLQRERDTGEYIMQVPILRLCSPNNETGQSQIRDCETHFKESEEERTKEEDKELSQIDNSYIYNNIKENDKEREIQKREKTETADEKPKRSRPPFVKPTVEEVRAYCRERQNTVRAEAFVNFYESKGWMVGKSPMKDWKAAVRTWEQKDRESGRFYVPPENRQGAEDDLPY